MEDTAADTPPPPASLRRSLVGSPSSAPRRLNSDISERKLCGFPPSTITDARTRRFGFFHLLPLPSGRQAMTGCDTPATGSSIVPRTEPCPSASPGEHRVPSASAPPSAISSPAAPGVSLERGRTTGSAGAPGSRFLSPCMHSS
ncbi:unnamed protein product [Pleuronectes platessa]|uniref:Uncharacterized protein n=1 Tax=Pleuronectes platessa TaxID=8262 RepID=A0A9N7VSP6_PLEPL|nr:unnamed protein product [Pleuronectes platessa]